ncbi:MAG: phytanoyl-CoA dioxygenase [Bacteroidetes bacterium HGW-Bacteroidetes-21]|jgi:predicted DNA-binding transcriptional regulator YafY|nr:MAG: phytanoyl-CoA dioxygenase [Bacteroidetes bacterium HGW-Bacteroidetes-21]
MPANRNALIRYKTIDICLQNRYRKWTLEDLIDSVSDAMYEYEGKKNGVSRRTVQLDIQIMRSDKLGYNAPIIVEDKKYYTYEDPSYSITNIPLSVNDLAKLTETVDLLKQFKGFSHFRELGSMVQKLEDHIYSKKENRKPVIDFEKNEDLKGLEFLDDLYQAITNRRIVCLTYQSFSARKPSTFNFQPYLLKEFRNRWFLIGIKKEKEPLLNLALDRIISLNITDDEFCVNDEFSSEEYFRDVIGVTVNQGCKPEKIILYITHKHAPYVLTKPLHCSQKVIGRDDFGVTISLEVQHNFELEKEILGLGDGVMVLEPERLKRNIIERISNVIESYNSNISQKGISAIQKKLIQKGYFLSNNIYTTRGLKQAGYIIKDVKSTEINLFSKEGEFLKQILLNRNINSITSLFGSSCIPLRIEFHNVISDENLFWNQEDHNEVFSLIVFLENRKHPNVNIQLIPGSHHKKLSSSEIDIIVSSCIPVEYKLEMGGVLFLHPNLLKRFTENEKGMQFKYFQVFFGFNV